jgi:molybdate transport system ATP-binding protein
MMRIAVDIEKTLRDASREFHLRMRFESTADVTILYGESGAGKSLTMQAIAGLMRPDKGRIVLSERVVFDSAHHIDVRARHRHVGLVFQDYALFPHLTVRQNIAFAQSRGWLNRRTVDKESSAAMANMQLDTLADAYPSDLSGGQRQRVALARALAARPQLLLLDEPFSALDSDLRNRLRDELIETHRRAGVPMIVITHDADDVAAFGGKVVRVRDGQVVA